MGLAPPQPYPAIYVRVSPKSVEPLGQLVLGSTSAPFSTPTLLLRHTYTQTRPRAPGQPPNGRLSLWHRLSAVAVAAVSMSSPRVCTPRTLPVASHTTMRRSRWRSLLSDRTTAHLSRLVVLALVHLLPAPTRPHAHIWNRGGRDGTETDEQRSAPLVLVVRVHATELSALLKTPRCCPIRSPRCSAASTTLPFTARQLPSTCTTAKTSKTRSSLPCTLTLATSLRSSARCQVETRFFCEV